ncbi:putative disease resistance protein [Forsythia ovata]|uniref:Disease resistance protein n=1 Tax=Forsythia ovata TaxID=205694 RepID=A0ABD1RZ16_9LAMI
MAHAALVSLAQTLEQILNANQSQVLDEDIRIRSFHEKVSFFLLFLEDSSQNNSEAFRSLEGRIRDATYKAQDIVDSGISNQVRVRPKFSFISFFWKITSAFNHNLNHDLKHDELEKVIEEFDSISQEALKMDRNPIEDLPPRNSLPASAGSSKSGSNNETPMVGFDDYLIRIKDQLTGPPSKLEIISFVGMGGIGKTTLARNVYNDSLIVYYFDTRAWTTVSQCYSVRGMLTDLLNFTRHLSHESDRKSIEELAESLYKSLKGRRYLIVMDDVWDINAWEQVKRFFPDDNNGSRIILTTRQTDVAIYAKSFSRIHIISFLSVQQSWNLLREKVFGVECCPPQLEVIGRTIAANCKGLPLALVVIGGLLYKAKRTPYYWNHIAENVSSTITRSDDEFMEILSLSYNHLPHHLRACFLYMGVFPEDHEICVSHLIKLWVATGFIKPGRSKGLEEVAKQYLEDLIDRNLILVRKRSYNGEIKTCSIHDLMRDLCVRKAQEEKFLQVLNWNADWSYPESTYNVRHLSIHLDSPYTVEGKHDLLAHSLLYFCRRGSNTLLPSSTIGFRLLRVFAALSIRFNDFPMQILELVKLRYIALIYVGDGNLPASISKLCNLQTLIIYRGHIKPRIATIPSEIWKMPWLRHLLLDRSILACPSGVNKSVILQSLQTLSQITNFRCNKEVLEMIPNLKKLVISYYHDSQTKWSSYCFENLVHLQQLEDLKCLFIAKSYYMTFLCPLPVNLAFPPKLKKLTLSGCGISWKNMTIVGSLPNLEVLKLKDHAFEGPVWETNEGEFCKLKFLLIERTHLENWKASKTHFPSLQCLSLRYCYKLVEIPSGIGEIPTLQVIRLYECCPSAVISAELIQEEQQSFGNDVLQVCIYSSKEDYEPGQGSTLHKSTWWY